MTTTNFHIASRGCRCHRCVPADPVLLEAMTDDPHGPTTYGPLPDVEAVRAAIFDEIMFLTDAWWWEHLGGDPANVPSEDDALEMFDAAVDDLLDRHQWTDPLGTTWQVVPIDWDPDYPDA